MAVKNSLVSRQGKLDFSVYLTQDAAKQQINKLLGGKVGPRFISALVSAVQANPALQECTNPSILSAALLGEALNLSPSLNWDSIIWYRLTIKARDVKRHSSSLGIKDISSWQNAVACIKKFNVISIKEGELVSYNPLEEELEVNLIEDDIIREETPTIGYYAMFEEVNGYKHSMYWSKRKMLAHADKYSQAFHLHAVTSSNPKYSRVSYEDFEKGNYPKEDAWKYSSFWYKDFDAMAHKTMLRQLISKWGTMSIDLQTAVEKDMAVIREDGSPEYVENEVQEDNVAVEQEYREVEQQEEPVQAASASQEPEGQMSMEDEFFRGL